MDKRTQKNDTNPLNEMLAFYMLPFVVWFYGLQALRVQNEVLWARKK